MIQSSAHRPDAGRAPVAPIVLPITSRGLPLTERVCWGILALASALAAGLILYLNRGTTFFFDQLRWLYETPELSAGNLFDPHNGHLIVTTRLAYRAVLETLGSGYLPFRVMGAAAVVAAAILFYALAKRRIGALPALVPAIVLLFLGSAWQHVVVPIGFTPLAAIAAGLGALLALERGDRHGDLAACALLVLSVATYTTGLAFVVGVAVWVLVQPERRARAWIFVIPAALYAAWWLWALGAEQSSEGQVRASNLLLIPNYVADSLAAAAAAVTGLGYAFAGSGVLELGWGRVVAALGLAALGLRLLRGRVARTLWALAAIVLTFWVLGALVADAQRLPTDVRFLYMGSLGVLLVAVEAARGARLSRVGLLVLLAAGTVSLATNVSLMRERAAAFRADSATAQAEMAMVDLAGGNADPAFRLGTVLSSHSVMRNLTVAQYLAAADRYGSPGLSTSELEQQPGSVRTQADKVLATLLGVRLAPGREGAASDSPCRRVSGAEAGDPRGVALGAGGAELAVSGPAPAAVSVGRFADTAGFELGQASPGRPVRVEVPVDAGLPPWRASVAGARSVRICELD